MKDSKDLLLALKEFPAKSYESFDLDRLAIYALLAMEVKKIPLYFDYASVALFKFFPKKFSMANFQQFPDTNRINKTLRRLTDAKRKRWATGTVENGFNMTELGREIAKHTSEILSNPSLKSERKIVATKSRGKTADAEVQKIRESILFKKWLEDSDSITNHDIFAFLQAAPYTPKDLLIAHIGKMQNLAKDAADSKVGSFITWVEERVESLFETV